MFRSNSITLISLILPRYYLQIMLKCIQHDFDSGPEQNFFKTILLTLNHSIADVKVLLFTGSLMNTPKTIFTLSTKALITIITVIFPIL